MRHATDRPLFDLPADAALTDDLAEVIRLLRAQHELLQTVVKELKQIRALVAKQATSAVKESIE
jgi:hypothetical protein